MTRMYKENIGLASQIAKEREEEFLQQELREKHEIKDENVIVVEKPSLLKFLIKLGVRIIKTIATIIILCLATIGLLGIIYDGPRQELITILGLIKIEVMGMFT